MKPMSIARAVTIILMCVCALQSAAVPFPESEVRLEEPVESDAPQNLDQGVAATLDLAKETSPEVLFRTKRQSHLSLCFYCYNCCKNKGCGYCCKF
ncbi:hepcidin-1-like [Neoarius graeffei]|uniref:hepcidin-1-like n=1 Tax=Neoarius graeffei TaxID=443677 RepID=UPI00298C232B|nr:hepcidin-1-like [Neoarius graeffei]